MVQWVNFNRNNRSVIVHRYSALSEKAGPVLLLLEDLTAGSLAGRLAGWQADEMWVDFKIFKILYGQTSCIFTSFNIVIILL